MGRIHEGVQYGPKFEVQYIQIQMTMQQRARTKNTRRTKRAKQQTAHLKQAAEGTDTHCFAGTSSRRLWGIRCDKQRTLATLPVLAHNIRPRQHTTAETNLVGRTPRMSEEGTE